MRNLAIAAFVTVLSLGAVACNEPGAGSNETAEVYSEQQSERERANAKQEYVQEAERRMQALQAEINALKVKAENAGAQAKVEMQRQVEQLEVKAQQAQTRFEELKESSEEAWREFKAGLDAALDDLEAAAERAKAKFE